MRNTTGQNRYFYFGMSVYCMLTLSLFTQAAQAADGKGIASHLLLQVGWEWMKYSEEVPEIALTSKAEPSNWILGFEGVKRWPRVFAGVKGVLPVSRQDDQEQWWKTGNLNQTNRLESGWTRVDGFVGYPMWPQLSPFIGLRWSEVRQERSHFAGSSGQSLSSISVTETVSAYELLAGIRGAVPIKPGWEVSYELEYLVPFSSEVKNSSLPGWDFSNADGWTLEIQGGITYQVSPMMQAGLQLAGGRRHWKGSDWQRIPGGWVKWPENDTDFFSAMMMTEMDF